MIQRDNNILMFFRSFVFAGLFVLVCVCGVCAQGASPASAPVRVVGGSATNEAEPEEAVEGEAAEDVVGGEIEEAAVKGGKAKKDAKVKIGRDSSSVIPRPVIAIKTNMLFDFAGIPNVELEIPLGSRFSLAGEYQAGWYLRNNSYAMQMHTYGAEMRYWMSNRVGGRMMTGWFLGGFVMSGFYDIQHAYNAGYQGEINFLAGASFGFATPISRAISLEFSLGFGYVMTHYRNYRVSHDEFLSLDGSEMRYQAVVPAKGKVSLSWLLFRRIYDN